jgi:zinc transport system substrate-binding protein
MRLLLSSAILAALAAPASAAPPRIVADTAITGALVAQVLGDLGEPHVLLPSGASVHHYQMRPSDAQALQSAGLLVWFGPELTPWLDRAADAGGTGAPQLELLDASDVTLRSYAEDGQHDHDEGHDHEGHDHEGHDHEVQDHGHDHAHEHGDDHQHDGTDPHAWLNPMNAAPWLTAIARELSKLDPENAATYAANADAAAQDYLALDQKIAQQLTPLTDKSFVVFHDAYGYFTEHFGLPPAIAVSLGDATSPSAARLSEVRSQIAESGASCAFPEYGHDPKLIDTVIEGSDVAMGDELDPAGAGLSPGPMLYRDVLQRMSDTLNACLTTE